MTHFFISYAKKDTKELAFKLADELAKIRGVTTWVDKELDAGDNFSQKIETQIKDCNWMIVLLSPDVDREADSHGNLSYVRLEITYMVTCNKRQFIIPVKVKDSGKPGPIDLAGLNWIDFQNKSIDTPVDFAGLLASICDKAQLQMPSQWHQILDDWNRNEELKRHKAAEDAAKAIRDERDRLERDRRLRELRKNWVRYVLRYTLFALTLSVCLITFNAVRSLNVPRCSLFAPEFSAPNGQRPKYSFTAKTNGHWTPYVLLDSMDNMQRLSNGSYNAVVTSWFQDGNRFLLETNQGDAEGNFEIYVSMLNNLTAEPHNLTQHPDSDEGAKLSPDDSRIAFVSDRDGDDDIYVMNSDGSNLRQITQNRIKDVNPAWSPDGTQIVYASCEAPEGEEKSCTINIVDANGQNRRTLLTTPFSAAVTWSQNGIAFMHREDRNAGIYTIQPDGSNLKPLFVPEHRIDFAIKSFFQGFSLGDFGWFGNDKRLSFEMGFGEGRQLYSIKADGTDLCWITDGSVPSSIFRSSLAY